MTKKTKGKTVRKHVTSVGQLRASRAIDAVVPAYIQWCRETHDLPTEDAMVYLKPVESLVAAYFELTPSSVATAFEAEPFGTALQTMYVAAGVTDGAIEFAFEAIHLYVKFLGMSGTWTGTEFDYEIIDELFHMDEDEALAELEGPELTPPLPSPEEELAALTGTELARRLTAFLQWLGDGRQVTSTGSLKLLEIEGAAAAVGIAAKGAERNAKRQELSGFDATNLPEGTPRTVKTMHELPLLSKIWAALEGGGFIDIRSTKVRPTPNVEAFLDPGHPGHLPAMRGLAADFLSVAVKGEQAWAPWVVQAAEAQAGLLYAATLPNATVTVASMSDTDMLASMGVEEFGGRHLRRRMTELAELGLVTMDKFVRVPPGLVPVVLQALGEPVADDGGAEPMLPGSVGLAPTQAVPTHPVPILQLKVSIQDAKPPVWRRLQLRSDLTLAQLHRIIQLSFEWLDYHLHEFNSGGRNGSYYGPLDSYDDGFGDPFSDPPQDETAVTVGQLLTAEKDHFTYTYDFGDNWRHKITLEKILPFTPGSPAVRCTGGRGMGPAEDSGGVWGWQNVVTAVNDPSHEEHTEYLEWLGMRVGETLDPKEFDKEALDEDLAGLF